MKCSRCRNKAIIQNPKLCKVHFINYFENKVKETIRKYRLLDRKERICVAASGGKDSTSLLLVLKRLGYNVFALAVDEGIPKYRKQKMKELKRFCKDNKIKLRIVSFKEEFGKELHEVIKNKNIHPCTICGTLRRWLLNKYSKGFDKIATGHNADDEAQTILMNLLKANTNFFFRQGPITGVSRKGFTQRVKPFYFLKEKEIKLFSFLNNIAEDFVECPFITGSFRDKVRKELNNYENTYSGTKNNILKNYLKLKERVKIEGDTNYCRLCGDPSANEECKACSLVKQLF